MEKLRFAVILLAVSGTCASPRPPFTPSDSIMDIIDTEKVKELIAARQLAAISNDMVQTNDLDDEVKIASSLDEDTSTSKIPIYDFRKILKSPKKALVITKKEYLKEDWCKAEPLVQRIQEPGCLPVKLVNNFCYGQCNSFYIPKGPRRRDGAEEKPMQAFKSCSFCRPKKVVWVTVTLRCPGLDPPYRKKRVQKIMQCKCLPVGLN